MHIHEYRRLLRRRLTSPITQGQSSELDYQSIQLYPRQYKQMVLSPQMTDGIVVVEEVPLNPFLDRDLYQQALKKRIDIKCDIADKVIGDGYQMINERKDYIENDQLNGMHQIVKIPAP
ncbi:MAG: hypothetical protein EZS28_044697, partial [Streblomastix strix]